VLAGAKTATLDLYGDGLLSLDVSNQVTQAPRGPDGKPVTALVTSTGVVIADGGTVQLTARAADGIVQNLVQAGGTIRAATMGDHTGTIALNGVGGSIVVEGQLSAPGRRPGTTGGSIEVVSDGNVSIASTARINGSGQAGGGVVAIGTTLARAKGGPSVTAGRTAKNVAVQQGATITADAQAMGNGGRVVALSDQSTGTTQIDGAISAKGGPQGGNGGFVETSGWMLGVGNGAVINVGARAPSGQSGTWLLDPFDIAITTADNNTNGATTAGTSTFTGSADPATIANTTLQTALGTDNVVVSTTGGGKDLGNITVAAAVTWASGNSLTLRADNNIAINSSISGTGGSLILSAGNTTNTGSITISAPISAKGGITLSGGAINLSADISGATVTFSTTGFGSVLQTSGTLTAGTLAGNIAGGMSLSEPANAVSSLGSLSLGFTGSLADSVPLSISGAVNSGTGFLNLSSTSAITEAATGSITGAFSAVANGNVSLTAHNSIPLSNGIVSKNGNVLIVNDTDLTLVGSFSGNNLFFQVASKGGTLTLSDADPSSDFPNPAMLTAAAGGRISLVADNYAILPNSRSKLVDSTITAPTVELAPFSTTINTSLLAGNGLLINTTMLSIIQTNGGTLEVGGFTNLPAGATTPAPSTTAIDIGAPLDLTAIASTLRLDANGPVSQSGGPLTVPALVGSGGAWTLNNAANAVSTLGNVTAASFSLLDSTNLTVAGTLSATTAASITDPLTVTVAGLVNAGAAGLSAHDIDIIGSVNAGTIALNAKGGAINATGVLVADELTGSATTAASLTGANRIAALGAFTVGTNLILSDNVDLLIASALNGPQIAIRDPANRISVADGAVITTGGNARPAGPIQSTLEPSTGMPGALFQAASFTQIGNSFVVGQGGGPATLQISITGNAQFDPPLGLQAASTWLILNLTNGTAAGNVFVNALDVSYTTPGSTNLTGTIAGINGGPAAAVGNIAPAINANYLFNGCIIAAALCHPPAPPTPTPTPIPRVVVNLNTGLTATLGAIYPLLSLAPAAITSPPKLSLIALPMLTPRPPQLTDPDVVPPNITFLDY
jgi:hypothetical protein